MGKAAIDIEYKRSKLAAEDKLQELKETYSSKYPEIKDLNSAKHWDERQNLRMDLMQQDGMTQDRVRMAARFVPNSVQKILDIGIGHGWVEEILEKRNITFYGNDISPQTIHNIKERFKGHFTVQTLYMLNYEKSFFDAVLLLEVLEHVSPSKTLRVLKKIHTFLKPNGYFILSIPTNEGLDKMKNNPSGHVRMYTIPLIQAELEITGFKILQLKTLHAFSTHYALKKLIAKAWKNRWKPNNIIIQAQKI